MCFTRWPRDGRPSSSCIADVSQISCKDVNIPSLLDLFLNRSTLNWSRSLLHRRQVVYFFFITAFLGVFPVHVYNNVEY